MRDRIKSTLRLFLGDNFSSYLLQKAKKTINIVYLISNTFTDFKLYYRYSTLFKLDNIKKEEALLILDYHSVEKGMLFSKMKPRFAQHKIERLHGHLKSKRLLQNLDRTQVEVTL